LFTFTAPLPHAYTRWRCYRTTFIYPRFCVTAVTLPHPTNVTFGLRYSLILVYGIRCGCYRSPTATFLIGDTYRLLRLHALFLVCCYLLYLRLHTTFMVGLLIYRWLPSVAFHTALLYPLHFPARGYITDSFAALPILLPRCWCYVYVGIPVYAHTFDLICGLRCRYVLLCC